MSDSWQVLANLTQGRRALGGKLVVEGDRIRFEPHAVDRATGGEAREWDLLALRAVDRAPRTWNPFDGGLRRRLRLRFADGEVALLVVNRMVDTARRIVDSAHAVGGSVVLKL